MKISVLVITLWLHSSSCRILSNSMDNDIGSTSNNIVFGRSKDWVKINIAPVPVISRPVGARVELECEAIGSPVPTVQWLKGNTPVTDNDEFDTNMLSDLPTSGMAKVRSRLVIPSSLSIHEDSYTCLAESGSQMATAKSRLFVERNGTPEKNFTQLLTEEILGGRQPARIVLFNVIFMDNIGTDVILPCKAIGNPRPLVTWYDPTGDKVANGNDARVTVHPEGELRIRSVHWSDMGPYTCVAENNIARDSITTFVYPMLAKK